MKVLVSAASRHGATAEIAAKLGEALGGVLGEEAVDVRPADQVGSVDDYDAVVLGSAVYMGRWLEPARKLAEGRAGDLSGKATWLFSSGPVGQPLQPDEDPVDVAGIMQATGAREHRVFPGKLDKGTLGFTERAVVLAFRAPEGDFRDWEAVRSWAGSIADALRSEVPA